MSLCDGRRSVERQRRRRTDWIGVKAINEYVFSYKMQARYHETLINELINKTNETARITKDGRRWHNVLFNANPHEV